VIRLRRYYILGYRTQRDKAFPLNREFFDFAAGSTGLVPKIISQIRLLSVNSRGGPIGNFRAPNRELGPPNRKLFLTVMNFKRRIMLRHIYFDFH
jgi:hypothetical protein